MKNIINQEYAPKRATIQSAGYDLYANESVTLYPGKYITLDTGVVFEDNDKLVGVIGLPIKHGKKTTVDPVIAVSGEYVGIVFPRSSYGFNYGLRFANTVCIIDQDYRDTIKLRVTVDKQFDIKAGDRIAQLVFVPWLILTNEEKPTKSRNGGVGSTGN